MCAHCCTPMPTTHKIMECTNKWTTLKSSKAARCQRGSWVGEAPPSSTDTAQLTVESWPHLPFCPSLLGQGSPGPPSPLRVLHYFIRSKKITHLHKKVSKMDRHLPKEHHGPTKRDEGENHQNGPLVKSGEVHSVSLFPDSAPSPASPSQSFSQPPPHWVQGLSHTPAHPRKKSLLRLKA